jgi:hypothetical protein
VGADERAILFMAQHFTLLTNLHLWKWESFRKILKVISEYGEIIEGNEGIN